MKLYTAKEMANELNLPYGKVRDRLQYAVYEEKGYRPGPNCSVKKLYDDNTLEALREYFKTHEHGTIKKPMFF